MTKIRIINESKWPLPKYQTKGASGVDLHADIEEPITIRPQSIEQISSGIRISMPRGYEAQIRSRSGLASKNGIAVLNSPGSIDSDYRGLIYIVLVNHGKEDYVIEPGTRIAQMVFAKYETIEFELANSLDKTARNDGGLGSTKTTAT